MSSASRKKLLFLIKAVFTMGKNPQSFLDAGYIAGLLKACPNRYRRDLALWFLSLSPHYYFRDLKETYARISYKEFLEAEFKRNRDSRRRIYSEILKPFLDQKDVLLDYGCGAGFLAKLVSEHSHKVFAVDISRGVLECARILNSSPNLVYLWTQEMNNAIPPNSVDLVYSIAVVQHVTNLILEGILAACQSKLRPGGRILLHVQLEDSEWQSEEIWISDTSLAGKIKYRYGLHCFSRSAESLIRMLEKTGYCNIQILPIADLCAVPFDDICRQHLIMADKT
jgi:SAM-dependent methyltransferase